MHMSFSGKYGCPPSYMYNTFVVVQLQLSQVWAPSCNYVFLSHFVSLIWLDTCNGLLILKVLGDG